METLRIGSTISKIYPKNAKDKYGHIVRQYGSNYTIKVRKIKSVKEEFSYNE